MKHILCLAGMLVLVFGSSAALKETVAARISVPTANVVEIEGVEVNGQKAMLKAGYQFQRDGINSVAVLKTSNVSRIQTGTLICARPGRGGCSVLIAKNRAACSNSCYFVGVRGGVRAQ